MAVSVCLDDIFLTTERFVIKPGVVVQHHKLECFVEKLVYCDQGQSHSKGSKCQCMSRWYLLNQQTFCYQTWYCDASSWARVSCKKIGLLFHPCWCQYNLWRTKGCANIYIFFASLRLRSFYNGNCIFGYPVTAQRLGTGFECTVQ